MNEAQHQRMVMQWAEQSGIPELRLLFHVPNGGSRNPAEARHLKEQGVKKGVPDLCLPVPRGRYGCLFIEMKAEKGRLRPEQRDWIDNLNAVGCFAEVCHGWESAVRVLEWYLSLKDGQP